MPGFEVVDIEERIAVEKIFTEGNGVLFAHGFDALRDRFRVREFEAAFAKRFQAKHAQAVTSGSAALLVALKVLDIQPGDEVITQSFTFVATVEAILMLGAKPVITEIDDTYNMDPQDLQKKITDKTKAIIPVHMAGVPAQMDRIMAIAKQHGIPVLEDTAQAIGSRFDGQYCGTIGDIGAFSLDGGKTVMAGEGGVVLTNNARLYQEALAFHDHGHEYNQTVGRADDTRHGWGFNFRMNELTAAVAQVQLGKLDHMLASAKRVKTSIVDSLKAANLGLQFRRIPERAEENYDSIIFYVENANRAKQIVSALKAAGIGTKNVPDALRWHFAGLWEHMCEDLTAWPKSQALLERSIALPVMVKWQDSFIAEYVNKIIAAIQGIA